MLNNIKLLFCFSFVFVFLETQLASIKIRPKLQKIRGRYQSSALILSLTTLYALYSIPSFKLFRFYIFSLPPRLRHSTNLEIKPLGQTLKISDPINTFTIIKVCQVQTQFKTENTTSRFKIYNVWAIMTAELVKIIRYKQ